MRIISKTFPQSTVNRNAHLFLKMVSAEISDLQTNILNPENLSKPQVKALGRFKTYTHLTIKQADKGGSTVVLDNEHYKRLCLDILDNKNWYKPISFKQADGFMIKFYGIVEDAFEKNVINKKLWQYIRTPHPRMSTFYCLPKLHKIGALRGRPIVYGSRNLMEAASKLIDWTLQSHVTTLFSFFKDTLSFWQFM